MIAQRQSRVRSAEVNSELDEVYKILNEIKILKIVKARVDYFMVEDDEIIGVTRDGLVITLVLAERFKNKTVIIKDESGLAGSTGITMRRSGLAEIDGATNVNISTNFGVLRLYSDGTDWFSW